MNAKAVPQGKQAELQSIHGGSTRLNCVRRTRVTTLNDSPMKTTRGILFLCLSLGVWRPSIFQNDTGDPIALLGAIRPTGNEPTHIIILPVVGFSGDPASSPAMENGI
jgi:hypothetical protein